MRDLSKNSNYITKSKISRSELDKMGFPKYISVSEVRDNFDMLNGVGQKTGNPYNYKQQRYTKFVHKKELYDLTIKGRTRRHR